MKIYMSILSAMLMLFSSIPISVAADPNLVMDESVIMIRHGIRSPTSSEINLYERITTKEWPKWPSRPGALSEHGKKTTELLGAYYKARNQAILPKGGCPTDKDIFVWSNSGSSRTTDTGNALLKGMYPNCNLTTKHKNSNDVDPMFWAYGVGAAILEPAKTKAAILQAMGGGVEQAKLKYKETLDYASEVIPCCHVSICEMAGLAPDCKLKDLPWHIKEGGDDVVFYQLTGGADMAQALAEHIRMAYAEGIPLPDVGWGAINNAKNVKRILEAHEMRYDLYEHVPYVAEKGGSQLLKQIVLALTDGTDAKLNFPRDGAFPSTKLLVLSGHDTNLANLRAMLGITWALDDYPDNDTGPLGAIVFDRLTDQRSGKAYLQIAYITPRLDVLRRGLPMTDKNAPQEVIVNIPGCKDQVGKACELHESVDILSKKIDMGSTWINSQ